jgi:hypothetical protein
MFQHDNRERSASSALKFSKPGMVTEYFQQNKTPF